MLETVLGEVEKASFIALPGKGSHGSLLILMSFSGSFKLASGGFLAAPWLATAWIHPLELREGHGGWSLAYKKLGTKEGPEGPQGPPVSELLTEHRKVLYLQLQS